MSSQQQHRIVLASASPRRKEILERLGLDFEVLASSEPEHEVKILNDVIVAAQKKAKFAAGELSKKGGYEGSVVIGADTVVAAGGDAISEILGKPRDKEEAIKMLESLSGKKHVVATGLCTVIMNGNNPESFDSFSSIEKTEVLFRTLNKEEIIRYVETGEPMDKAGSYAIQGHGGVFVEAITGCYTNVVGLPVTLLLDQLSQIPSIK